MADLSVDKIELVKSAVPRVERPRELREARLTAGLTQAELAQRVGISASNISAYEAGSRPLSDAMFARILAAARPLPSVVLRANAARVLEVARRHGAIDVSVFGSVARGEDHYDSDIDLLVSFRSGTDLFDLVDLTDELENLLGTRVDVISVGGLKDRDGHIRAEAVPL